MDRFILIGDRLYNIKFICNIVCNDSDCLIYFDNKNFHHKYKNGTKGYADLMRLMEQGKPDLSDPRDLWDVK